jgi:hypothetical protein
VIAETFTRSLRTLVRRVPFRPFLVELMSGAQVTVSHPEALAFDGGQAAYIAPNGDISLFDHESVSRLHDGSDSADEKTG